MRSCPRCRASLVDAPGGTVASDRCGSWYDRAELTAALAPHVPAEPIDPGRARRALNEIRVVPPAERGYVPCPTCGLLMNRRNFGSISGVLVDVCKPHGLWLDGGELEKLTRFIERGGGALVEELRRPVAPLPRVSSEPPPESSKWRSAAGTVQKPWHECAQGWLAAEVEKLFA